MLQDATYLCVLRWLAGYGGRALPVTQLPDGYVLDPSLLSNKNHVNTGRHFIAIWVNIDAESRAKSEIGQA